MNKKLLLAVILGALATSCAWAGTNEWTSGWGMGISEHLVTDGNDNALNIACPDSSEDGYVRAHATIAGKEYSSNDGTGFDVIVDGIRYNNPFFTDCRACSANFPAFWEALRKANNLEVSAAGHTAKLPTKNINTVLRPLNHKENNCQSAW